MAASIKDITQAIFVNRKSYKDLSDKDKATFFFIFNRYMSKKFPLQANALNDKSIDKASAMDVWYYQFRSSIMVPKWYWNKKKEESKREYTQKKIDGFLKYHELKMEDYEFLQRFYADEVKDEMKRLSKLEEHRKIVEDDI